MDIIFNYKFYLIISMFSFVMFITSGIFLLHTEPPTSWFECFIGYGICSVAFFMLGLMQAFTND